MPRNYGPTEQHPAPEGTPEDQKQDDVLDRPGGEEYNPNDARVVAEGRARFAAENRRIQRRRRQAKEQRSRENERFVREAQQAENNPEHQEMVEHQEHHTRSSPAQEHAGQEEQVPDDTSQGSTHADPNMRPAEHPGSPVDPDRFLQPPIL